MTVTTLVIQQRQKKMVKMLSMVLLVMFLLYGYFIINSVVNVLVRQELHSQSIALGSELGILESEYLALKDLINEDYAFTMGFVADDTRHYVERRSVVSALQGENSGQ
jgi:presenilin-like A22 family membrane protease